MKTQKLLVATLLLTPALLAFQPRGTEIAFTVKEGTTKTKTFSSSTELSLDDMSMLMNGQESPMMPEIEMTITSNLEVAVSDEYVTMRDGAPGKLLRTYDTLEQGQSMEMEIDIMGQVQSQDQDVPAKSELEGETIAFKWNEEEGEFVAAFPEGEGNEDLLENLIEDMDLRALLPESEVSDGDEWKIDPAALATVLTPGGDLKFVPEENDSEDMMGMNSEMGDFSDWFSEDIEGEITATFTGTRETDEGVNVGVIVLSIEIANAVDMTEKVQEQMENADLPGEVGSMEMNSMDIALEFEGEGTMLWNLAEGCAHSFELSGDITLQVEMSMSISAQGMDMEIEQSLELSGSMSTEASIE